MQEISEDFGVSSLREYRCIRPVSQFSLTYGTVPESKRVIISDPTKTCSLPRVRSYKKRRIPTWLFLLYRQARTVSVSATHYVRNVRRLWSLIFAFTNQLCLGMELTQTLPKFPHEITSGGFLLQQNIKDFTLRWWYGTVSYTVPIH